MGDFFKETYSDDENPWWRRKKDEPIQKILDYAKEEDKIISIGCGDLCEGRHIENTTSTDVHGVDKETKIKDMYEDSITSLEIIDITEESPSVQTDKAYDVNCFVHLTDKQRESYIENLSKKCGKVLIVMKENTEEEEITEPVYTNLESRASITDFLESLGCEVSDITSIGDVVGEPMMAVEVILE